MDPILAIVGVVVLVIVVRVIAGSFDGERVERYVQENGWELVGRSWDPFGPGWFGEKDARIYQIVYRDSQGVLHRAHVKTSLFSGVYLTNDHIVKETQLGPQPGGDELLAGENRRLHERIREL